MKKSILFIVNVDWFFVSHRLPIALAAIRSNYSVHLACHFTDRVDYLESLGIEVHPLHLSRGGTGLVSEAKSFIAIFNIIKQVRPGLVHFITIKPSLYGGIASRLLGIKQRVASISGLGYVFVSQGFKARAFRFVVSKLYRLALHGNHTQVIFQNPDDKQQFINSGIISTEQAWLIRGSGVSLQKYPFLPEPDGETVVVFASRLLKDKGVEEFVQAARLIRSRGMEVRFWLIGDRDPDNPASVSQKTLDAWRAENDVEILGYRSDIQNLLTKSHIIVLPSYYGEGLPKVLVEAAACGRAVVTTDHPGCRDAIEPDKTGLLVPVRDSGALADAIQKLILDPELRRSMGRAGRGLAEREFAIEKIVDAHLDIYESLEKSC